MFDVTSANSTSTSSSETSLELLNDRINLIAATTLLGVTYGIIACLYCLITYSLIKKLFRRNARSGSHPNSLSRSRTDLHNIVFHLVYSSVLFVLATLYTAGNSQNAIIAYVDNRLYQGGPSQYYVMYMTGQRIMLMTDVSAVLILWITDALILCRFIVMYYQIPYARWIIPLPCAMYIGVIVLSTAVLNAEVSLNRIFYLSENLLLAYYVLSFSLNIITTVLIAARLYWHKVQLERVFGSKTESPYLGIAAMVVESAAIYGAWSVVFLILCIQQSPGQIIILATISEIQVIATLLITLWFARGEAWNCDKSYGDDVDTRHSGGVGGLTFSSRAANLGDELSVDNIHPNTGRNASWSTVVGSSKAGDRDDDGNLIELGLCGSKSSILADNLKA